MAAQSQTNNINKPLIKKSASTDNLYQSTFMPIFQKAETKIKKLVLMAFFLSIARYILMNQIAGVIASVSAQIPKDLRDKEAYLRGLKRTSEYYIQTFYKPMKANFEEVKKKCEELKIEPPKRPQDMEMWSKRKGSPNVTDYQKELKKKINELSEMPMTTEQEDKKPISLWQKAELDVRYEHQIEMVDKLKGEGVQLAYISSHVNCSKRCEAWQGSLVSLTEHANSPQTHVDKKFKYSKMSFFIKKVENHNVYSLPDIMAVVDDYGYNNNVICGFNCRHRLIPYTGQLAPEKYSKEDVAKQRAIEEKIRKMEREIRAQKTRAELYKEIGETRIYRAIMENVKIMVSQYQAFCEKYGYAWYDYRIEVM